MKNEEDYLLLSQLTHAGYCLRRAALVMNEQIWSENTDTVKGKQDHQHVHNHRIECRGEEIKLYEYDVVSHTLRIRGKCDCIEAVHDSNGCNVPFANFPVILKPVEYKHGRIRDEEEYNMQLCAQAMCLEEMYQCNIPEGDIFYTTSHRRYQVKFTNGLRQRVREILLLLEKIKDEFYLPPAEHSVKCKKCSLLKICLPTMKKTAKAYCTLVKNEAQGVEYL